MKRAFSLLELVIAFALFLIAFLPFLSFQKEIFHAVRREQGLAKREQEFRNAILSLAFYEEERKLFQKKYYHEGIQWTEEREGALWQSVAMEASDKASYRILIQSLEGETLWETWISKERWKHEKESLFPLRTEH